MLTWELVWKLEEREARQALLRPRVGVPKCCGAGPHGQGREELGPASMGLAVGTRSGMG